MKQLSIVLAMLVSSFVWGQTSNYEYGRVDAKDLRMESYEKDPEAEALVLYEHGYAEIRQTYNGLQLFFIYKGRYKILDKSGFEHATFSIPLQINDNKTKMETLESMRATSYNVDAPPMAIGKDDILYEKYNDNFKIAKFTIPKVKEGTIFDVEFEVKSPFYFYNFHTWKFQSDIPKLYSEYITKIPANFKYNAKLVGPIKFDNHLGDVEKMCVEIGGGAADCEVNHYIMKDIPAFREEGFMTSKENYLSQIKYEIRETQNFQGVKQSYAKTWKDVDHEIKTSFDLGKQARKERAFVKLIPPTLAAMPKSLEKAKLIYTYLQEVMHWNGEYFLFKDVDVKEAYENKKGSIAELNLVLLNMLKASGFEAYMVLAREREDGFPTLLYPVLTDFNYLFVKLVQDNKVYYLDITDEYLPFGMLPMKALNNYGRVIDFDNESYWDNIYMNSMSVKNVFTQYNIDSEGYINIKKSEKRSGFLATQKRKIINNTDEETYLKNIEDNYSSTHDAIVTSYSNKNAEDTEKQLQELFEINYEEPLEEEQVFFNPVEGSLFSENPFKLKERTYPVDFGYPHAYIYKFLVIVDDEYEITNIPENIKDDFKNYLSLDFKVNKNGNTVSFDVGVYIRKAVFSPEEYQEVKRIFSEIVDITTNANIVIKKKA